MKKFLLRFKNILLLILIMCAAFFISLAISRIFSDVSLVPAIFVLAVFIISLVTDGYYFGISASVISVLALNYAFAFPYFRFNFTMSENIVSAICNK